MHLTTVSVLTVILFGQMIEIQGSCDSKLENNLFKDLLNMMLKLKGSSSGSCHLGNGGARKDVPAFSASLSGATSYKAKENVIFDKVWANIGNGYDVSTGIFTAPQSGVYQFACTIMRSSNSIRVHLWKNEVKTVSIWPGNNDTKPGTLNIVLQLQKGDKIFIQNAQTQQIYSESASHFSMFSGFMISN